MNYIIYAYYKKDNKEIVYVGLTNNLERRRQEHEKYEPYEKGRPHYNYPLSRGIRKYGEAYYDCKILEKGLSLEQAKEKEKYWIKYYDTYEDPSKYNLTPGGETTCWTKFEKETIEQVKKMLEQKKSFQEIMDKTQVSIPHISEINMGKRHFDENREYPINTQTCGRKLAQEDVFIILQLLNQGELRIPEIAKQFGVSDTVIRRINRGESYRQKELSYPIRKERTPQKKNKRLTQEEINELIVDLEQSFISFSELASKYDVGITTIYNINKGTTHKQKNKTYPLRK